jgi:dTDP-4-amino-4,6-dideoxygalactose transaminase
MKSIQSVADLAINGAPPAFTDTLHVGSPNVGSRDALDKYLDQIYASNWLTNNGPLVQELERRIADLHGVDHCVAMTNGTIALEIAIRALGLQGEVIIPSYTFIATAHALHWQAITPVFADIDPHTHNLDPAAVARMITPRTSGIIGVHVWGRAAPVAELQEIAQHNSLALMFDAAHAFGCSYRGEMIGSLGACEVLSFHATKFFNTFEGGAVLTNDGAMAGKMRLMRNFGFDGLDNVIYPGTNGKMTEISAAMGLVNLDSLDAMIETNQRVYECYRDRLSAVPGVELVEYDTSEKNNYQYVVMVVDDGFGVSRDEIVAALHAENIRARKYFWPGCHKMKPYSELYPHAGLLLPQTADIARKVVVLPTGAHVTEQVVEQVVAVISVLSSSRGLSLSMPSG